MSQSITFAYTLPIFTAQLTGYESSFARCR